MHESIVDTASAEWYPVHDVAVFRSEVIESKRSLLRKDIIDRLVYVVENNHRQNGSEDFLLHKAVIEAVQLHKSRCNVVFLRFHLTSEDYVLTLQEFFHSPEMMFVYHSAVEWR